MKIKSITFVIHDGEKNAVNLMQWQTKKRTLKEAWEDAHAELCRSKGIDPTMEEFSARYTMTGAVPGLVNWIPDNVPLRRATPQEARQLELEAT